MKFYFFKNSFAYWALTACCVSQSHAFLSKAIRITPSLFFERNTFDRVNGGPIKYINGDVSDAAKHLEPPIEEKKERKAKKTFKNPDRTHVCDQTGIPLSRYMTEMARLNPELEEVQSIFTSLQVACKAISKLVSTASLDDSLTGLQGGGGSINVQGEEQKKMDVIANDILKKALRWTGKLATLASEEDETPMPGMTPDPLQSQSAHNKQALIDSSGSYIAVFDPLDGSSNIDAGIPVGTIFGIWKHREEECGVEDYDDEICMEDALQSGNELVAAGYCLYSSATTLVFTLGDGVHSFTLDQSLGEFVQTHANMKIPSRGSIYSFNEGNRWDWDDSMQSYITNLQKGLGETETRYSSRYVGSMVADVHRTLQYGGIFGYPADKTNPNGKLRLLYEVAPMAFIMEQAGGMATTGTGSIMDIQPEQVHQRVPCILGSKDDVQELQKYYDVANHEYRSAIEEEFNRSASLQLCDDSGYQ